MFGSAVIGDFPPVADGGSSAARGLDLADPLLLPGSPRVTARHHLVQRACKLDSKRVGHRAMLGGTRGMRQYKT